MNLPTSEGDSFTNFVAYGTASVFHAPVGRRRHAGKIVDEAARLRSYSHTKLSRASNATAVVVASGLPALAIFVLNWVHSTTTRIGLTVLFTAVFVSIVALFTTLQVTSYR